MFYLSIILIVESTKNPLSRKISQTLDVLSFHTEKSCQLKHITRNFLL